MAPLPYLAETLGDPPVLLGFRSADHARAASLLPRAEVVVEPRLVTELLPDDPGDVMACGPEPMLDAIGARVPGAQLAREAPMACGYGACYGCVIEVEGVRAALRLRAGAAVTVTVPVLNASGCLDALTAPGRREIARRVRDEDCHAASTRGEPTAEVRRGRPRDAELDRPPEPRYRRIRGTGPSAAGQARGSDLGLGRWILGDGLRARCASASTIATPSRPSS